MAKNRQKLYATNKIWKRCLVYVCFLFVFASSLILCFYLLDTTYISNAHWLFYVLFFILALYTDFRGFPHPNFGYVSFDRVTQISSILVLGPIPAAVINGLASFLFPLVNNYLGGNKRKIVIAVFNNSAMMMLMMLLPSLLYANLGGEIPLFVLTIKQLSLLCVLLLSIQIINSFFMRILIHLREQKIKTYFSLFTTTIEITSGFAGILFALVLNNMDTASILLFVVIMLIAIKVINQFAIMRNQLEKQVQERTKDLLRKTKQLEYLATHDELTGLFNRRYINNHIKVLLEDETIDNNGIFIAFADIDDFKKINDTFSHDTGDEVLVKISQILQQFCNESLVIARYGGEEFLLCFFQANNTDVKAFCNKIRKKINTLDLNSIQNDFKVSVSIGVANANSNSLHETLISRADINLYKAKEKGKNQVVF